MSSTPRIELLTVTADGREILHSAVREDRLLAELRRLDAACLHVRAYDGGMLIAEAGEQHND